MSDPTRWRDALGREWEAHESGCISCDAVRGGAWLKRTVEELCGPLVPVEPMARVCLGRNEEGDVAWACHESTFPGAVAPWFFSAVKDLPTWPLTRANEIAAAFRVLGFLDATVEEVPDADA